MTVFNAMTTTKLGPGVRAIGKPRASPREIYEELTQLLQRFYTSRQLVYIPKDFDPDPEKRVYVCCVENQRGVGRDGRPLIIVQPSLFRGEATLDTMIRLYKGHTQYRYDYGRDKHADYPVAATEYELNSFFAYFNAKNVNGRPDDGRSIRDRNAFFSFVEVERSCTRERDWKLVFAHYV